MPYQVGTGGDDPLTESVRKSHCIKDGDILVFGSDGLFDNLDNAQISRLLIQFIIEKQKKTGLLIQFIIEKQKKTEEEKRYESLKNPASKKIRMSNKTRFSKNPNLIITLGDQKKSFSKEKKSFAKKEKKLLPGDQRRDMMGLSFLNEMSYEQYEQLMERNRSKSHEKNDLNISKISKSTF
jgi:hypothetical protein